MCYTRTIRRRNLVQSACTTRRGMSFGVKVLAHGPDDRVSLLSGLLTPHFTRALLHLDSVYIYIYKHSMLFLLGTTWTRSFCGELAVTLTLKRRPTPRHFLRSPVHLRRFCHVNANVLPDNVTKPVEVLWENFIPGYSWHGKIRLASPLWRIAEIRNDRSLIFRDDEKFWSALWKCFYGESMLFFFFFFLLCRLINERWAKIQMDELLQMFGIQFLQRREILFRNVFMEDDRYFFFCFLEHR